LYKTNIINCSFSPAIYLQLNNATDTPGKFDEAAQKSVLADSIMALDIPPNGGTIKPLVSYIKL